jgi:uncharacterized repeat protein (TIGR03803 family)
MRACCSIGLTAVWAILVPVVFLAGGASTAQTVSVLHNFTNNGTDGYYPYGGLIFDRSGNLYGTTSGGGVYGDGAVFELKRTQNGWMEETLHSFNENGTDGYSPWSTLVFDGAGNLYGTTSEGGTNNQGTVFELSPALGGGWAETILHSFSGTDGEDPIAGVILDANGNIYGTTAWGGSSTNPACTGGDHSGCGTVFELERQDGAWAINVLYSFDRTDGSYVTSGLIFDAEGSLYGTTQEGNTYDGGIVFELSPSTGGTWTETTLHVFAGGTDGANPLGGVIFDGLGNLYGTTGTGGGAGHQGTVFKLTPGGEGWTEMLLYEFKDSRVDGIIPYGNVVFDAKGNLYGATGDGGSRGIGATFKLAPSAGRWTETILNSFDATDGIYPNGSLILDSSGNLYGTTQAGGDGSGCPFGPCGVVFELTP